jgi:hypothetical protein
VPRNFFDLNPVQDRQCAKMFVARLRTCNCESPPQTPLFKQSVSMSAQGLISRIFRYLFVSARSQHPGPLILALNFISPHGDERFLSHPFDFLPFRCKPEELLGFLGKIDRDNVGLIVVRTLESSKSTFVQKPKAMDITRATSPATPATTTLLGLAWEAATPSPKLEVDRIPSFAPSTAARNHPMRAVRCRSMLLNATMYLSRSSTEPDLKCLFP